LTAKVDVDLVYVLLSGSVSKVTCQLQNQYVTPGNIRGDDGSLKGDANALNCPRKVSTILVLQMPLTI